MHNQHSMILAENWINEVTQSIRQSSLRFITPRYAILQWIALCPKPFTTEDVVAGLPNSSRATIYRTIEWLRSACWITQLHSYTDHHVYTRVVIGYHHLICIRCGVTHILSNSVLDQALANLLTISDFEIKGHVLESFGMCRNCREC